MTQEVTFRTPETGPIAPASEVPADRPAWLPENFATAEDFAKSYSELQAKHTQTAQELATFKKPAEETPPPTEEKTAGTAENSSDPAEQVANEAGFDLAPYSTEFDTTGDVSEENRAKIADGLKNVLGERAREIVDQYIDGSKVTVANQQTMFMQEAGGADAWKAMSEWAGKGGLPKNEVDALNAQLVAGDPTTVTFAIQTLRGKYETVHGKTGNLVTANGGNILGETGYQSAAQMSADMAKPEYKTDQAFRDKVRRKIALSAF
jgi:hypothetical protein